MQSTMHIGRRISAVVSLCVLFTLIAGLFGVAQADVGATTRTGSITVLRLQDDDVVGGKNARFKLTIEQAGTVVATLTDEDSKKATEFMNEYVSYAKSVLVTVPGKLIKDGGNYTLEVKLLKGSNVKGTAKCAIKTDKAVAKLENLTVSADMNPSGARLLNVSFKLPYSATVTAVVRNSAGVRVGTVIPTKTYSAGTHTVLWNGILDNGKCAPTGEYQLDISAKNANNATPRQIVSFKVNGASSKAIVGKSSGVFKTVILSNQPKEDQSATLVFHSDKAGTYAIKIVDKTTGKITNLSGKMKININRIEIPGSVFVAGNEYAIQLVGRAGSSVVGTGEISANAYISKPSIKSVQVPAKLQAGYGASLPITYTLGESSKVTLYIRGNDGKVITTFESMSSKKAGTHTSYWNGLDSKGNLLPSGRYRISIACSNAAGIASTTSAYFNYEGAVTGISKPSVSGAVKIFASAGSPKLPERTPADMIVKTTQAGTLKITLTRTDTGAQTVAYNGYHSAGTFTVSIPAKYLRVHTYKVEAKLYSGKNVLGTGVAYLQPQKVSPEVTNFVCDDSFDTEWTPAVRGSYDTASSGYQHVIVKNAKGEIVRSVGGGAYSSAGHQAFYWDGKDNAGKQVADGTYVIYVNYHDDYGKYSNTFKQTVKVDLNSYPKGVYGYAVVGKGTHKTEIPVYNAPNGTLKTITYGISASFTVLEDLGDWLYVEASCPNGNPQKGYVQASLLQKVEITSPYRLEVCISRTGSKKQTMWVYKNDKVIDKFDISSGVAEGSTPNGTYILLNRKPYFTVLSGQGICYDALRVCGGVMIHRVPMLYGSYASCVGQLGNVASHGCVRVPIDKSQWLYDVIPDTTPIIIFYD